MDNIEILKQGCQNISTGNIDGVLAIYHPDIVWADSTGFSFVTGDGIFHGPREVLENIFIPLAEHINSIHIDIKELFGADNKVRKTGHYAGT